MLPTIATGNVASALAGEYEVANSLRFNDDSNDYLTRTFSAGNRKTWSFSTWIKRCNLTNVNMNILGTDYTGMGEAYLLFRPGEQLMYGQYESGGTANNFSFQTNQAFRDISAWYNILFVWDTTQSTSSDRMKLYVNGTQVTSFSSSTYPSLNLDGVWNSGRVHYIGDATYGANLDGYLCETVFVDGTALSPTDVGEFDSDTNIWKPIDVSGLTFGTNGFYLDFENSGSLGADASGNGNNFTVNNLTSIDQTTDTCTNNFATMNSLIPSNITYSNGNNTIVYGTDYHATFGTLGFTQGKWYYETKIENVSIVTDQYIGIAGETAIVTGATYDATPSVFYSGDGSIYVDGTATQSSLTSFSGGTILGVAINMDSSQIDFYIDGVKQGTTETIPSNSGFYLPYVGGANPRSCSFNFGNPPFTITSGNSDGNNRGNFEYPVPSGYYALNTKNLAEYG